MNRVSIITVTLNRESLKEACKSVDNQTFKEWHHFVLGDGILPTEYKSEKRSTLGFSNSLGEKEPGANMPNGTPNPLLRWALKNLNLSEYVCFLDDDNTYREDYLEKMVNVLDSNLDTGLVLCGAEDLRYNQNIDGYPELGRCDNSAFLIRSKIARQVEYPYASMDKNVVQDCEYIQKCSEISKWINLPEKLLIFGSGYNIPPNRGEIMYLESWKLPQEAYKCAYEKEYNRALKIFLYALQQYELDAWSIRKVAEIYKILGDTRNAMKYFKMWENLYKKSKEHHFAVDFTYSVYLKLIGKDYKSLLKNSIEERIKWRNKEPNSLEHSYFLFLSYALLGDEINTRKYSKLLIKTDKNQLLWAYQDVAWDIRVFKNLIDVGISEMQEFLEE